MPLKIEATDDGRQLYIEATGELSWHEELVFRAARQQVEQLGIEGVWSPDGRTFTAADR